jgi:crotonobetainyl-CoA:carnitine CoA-transferase CaiB-like acyl-CoA transferase
MTSLLDGVRIIDLTAYQQGPVGTTLLADLGAEVIKVEPPGGELGRRIRRDESGFSPFFESYNRGKRSLAVDLKNAVGRDILLRLIRTADVVTHNFVAGGMERLRLGYAELSEINPKIVYVGATGYGPKGPLATAPAFDGAAQAITGTMAAQREDATGAPRPIIYGMADSLGGLMLAHAVSLGLFYRERTGSGVSLDVSIVGSLLFAQAVEVAESLYKRESNIMRYRLNPTFGPFRCAGGDWLVITSIDPAQWQRLTDVLDYEPLTSDPNMSRSRWRLEQRDIVEPLLEEAFTRGERTHWLTELARVGIPCAPVLDYVEMANHPQIVENGYVVPSTHHVAGAIRVVGCPITVDGIAASIGRAPVLGVDTEPLLQEAGCDEETIARLTDQGVIECSTREMKEVQ